jgi:putative ABC transport system ATP-binding protein
MNDQQGNDAAAAQPPLIRAHALCKTYREGNAQLRILDQVELRIERGECVALLGRSGSGKSTLLNLIAGIDQPDAGEICIDGQNLPQLPERERTLFRRRHIGFVYQFFNLLPTLSVSENIRLPLELNRWPEARIANRVSRLLDILGLAQRGDAFPDRLSGGEQQRVAIARALALQPDLVLADEPTGNLDAATGRQTLELLLQLTSDAAHTLLIVTHNREVAEAADRVLLLENGRLSDGGNRLAW